jgi:large subunit ribosomal protein L24
MKRIKKGDEVILLTGKDKGRRGTVQKVYSDDRVSVEGINVMTHYQRPNPQAGIEGGLLKKEAPVHISNVALYNPATGKADRAGFRFLEDGTKVRFFKSNNEVIDI